ncbi:EamA family transporter RarD [Fodinibacter luteus]|uniref:EamA family transporter RarD n=1 Tax=Fodinibacter luteus TaxID=552064 RepID=A0ABP8KQ33_9MICO
MSPPPSGSTTAGGDEAEVRRGTAYGFLAYGIWGAFPIYFAALAPSGAWEILAHRIVWTLVVCALALAVLRDVAWVRPFARNRRLVLGITAAALVLSLNWVVYVYAVLTERTYEAALGYFLNPLITIALGVLVLRERLRPLQWAAVGIGLLAVVVMAVGGGAFPWIAVVLALSFGTYGLVKKKVGRSLDALHSLVAETAVMTPFAVAILTVLLVTGGTTFLGHGGAHTALLVASGVVTAVPLLFFAAAARRIPLVTIGLLQFITPVLQLVVGVVVLDETVSTPHWVGFGIVWVALVVLTVDSLRAARTTRSERRALEPDEPNVPEVAEPCP